MRRHDPGRCRPGPADRLGAGQGPPAAGAADRPQDRPSTRPLRAGARRTSPSPLPHLWVGRNGPHDPVRDLPRPRPWSAPERAMPACHQATGSRPTSAQAACLCAHMSQDRATGSPGGRRGERILIRYRGLRAVRTAVSPGHRRASGREDHEPIGAIAIGQPAPGGPTGSAWRGRRPPGSGRPLGPLANWETASPAGYRGDRPRAARRVRRYRL
jgi:hypothetical protein